MKVLTRRITSFIFFFFFLSSLLYAGGGKASLPDTTDDTGNNPLRTIVNANNVFALNLYKNLSQKSGNLLFSPLSISDALAMTYAGARDKTEKQMAQVLHFTLPQKDLHPAFSELIGQITAEGKNKPYTLYLANALWGQKGYPFLSNFVQTINCSYKGGFFTVDFVGHAKEAREKINHWVEKQTNNRIKNLIEQGDIDSLTRIVLTNAIYFKGKWASSFKKKNTRLLPFYISAKKSVQVPMMYQEETFPFYKNNKIKVIELPYLGGDLSMIIILPNEIDGLYHFEQNLTSRHLNHLLTSLHKQQIKVYLPRFSLKTKYYLENILSKMGMSDAFSNRADFSEMDGTKNLKISRVIHQAYMEVNEEGTEAAAATAVVMQRKAIFRTQTFKADHRFLFMIVNRKLRSILFIGRVIDPN